MATCAGLFAALRRSDPGLIQQKHELYIDAVRLERARVVPIVGRVAACMGGDRRAAGNCSGALSPEARELWDQYIVSYAIALRALSDPTKMSDMERAVYRIAL